VIGVYVCRYILFFCKYEYIKTHPIRYCLCTQCLTVRNIEPATYCAIGEYKVHCTKSVLYCAKLIIYVSVSFRFHNLSNPKNLSPIKCQDVQKNVGIPKYKCPICPKKYMTSKHLVEHIKCMHGNKRNPFCEICGKDFRTESFEKHIQSHAALLPNDKVRKLVRNKHTL
jgi:hypothetical protein